MQMAANTARIEVASLGCKIEVPSAGAPIFEALYFPDPAGLYLLDNAAISRNACEARWNFSGAGWHTELAGRMSDRFCRNAFLASALFRKSQAWFPGRPERARGRSACDAGSVRCPRIGVRVATDMSRSSVALGNMRAVVIVIVLAFHSVLPYLAFLPDIPYRFDAAPYQWRAFPVIDSQRWFGFDLFCAWQDVSLMALMFFLSGLFVAGSLERKGAWTYLSDRLLRIGLPLALVVTFLMPIAYYPAYAATATDPSLGAYWKHLTALPFWPCGPQWFLWLLLGFNFLAAAVHRLAPGGIARLGRLAAATGDRPVRFFVVLAAISALAYVPLALAYSPWDWANFGPLSIQVSRPLHYLVYFTAGVALGAQGVDRGLLATDGALARHWAAWLAAAVGGFGLWAVPTSAVLEQGAGAAVILQIAAGLGYAIGCATGCLALLAVCLRFLWQRTRALDSLSANAYGMYMVHYVFAIWLQYALLSALLPAVGKAALVFVVTLALSWAVTVALGRVSFGAQPGTAKRQARSA
jgi:hypothetical protein